ncbi:MAG: SEC-C domain-containing protein [Alphaproteobacteria bacterium]|uniref:SEC-C domain-containing protein n=1 Tax=Candidatus Nitrobium versatile TaxID=2884831 RepID=A0A953M357_9BACT|nr:SEC-C domain-containing protein [Candidatus Nitrobium versatile]
MPGRNEPCWCGSGIKYKKCHLDADMLKQKQKHIASCRKS